MTDELVAIVSSAGVVERKLTLRADAGDLAWSPDGSHLAIQTEYQEVEIFSTSTWLPVIRWKAPGGNEQQRSTNSIAWRADSEVLFACDTRLNRKGFYALAPFDTIPPSLVVNGGVSSVSVTDPNFILDVVATDNVGFNPGSVRVSQNSVDSGSAAREGDGTFSMPLTLVQGINTIEVRLSDLNFNEVVNELVVEYLPLFDFEISDRQFVASGPDDGSYPLNEVITVEAAERDGFIFKHWAVAGGAAVSEDRVYRFFLEESVILEPIYEIRQYEVNLSVGPGGTASSSNDSGLVDHGQTVIFTASPNEGFAVSQWFLHGELVQAGGDSFSVVSATSRINATVTFAPINLADERINDWERSFFGDSQVYSDEDLTDGDGIPLIFQYHWGLNPTIVDGATGRPTSRIQQIDDNRYFVFEFSQRIDGGIYDTVQVSNDGTHWDSSEQQIEYVGTPVENADGITRRVTVRYAKTLSEDPGPVLFRLSAERSLAPDLISATTRLVLTAGETIDYQILANNTPTVYSATGLPPGILIDAQTGVLSGASPATGVFEVLLTAGNAHGSSSRVMWIELNQAVPQVSFEDWTSRPEVPLNRRGPMDSAANDGVANIVKYYQGIDPMDTCGNSGLKRMERPAANQMIAWFLRSLTTDGTISGRVRWSKDMVNWHDGGSTDAGTTVLIDTSQFDPDPSDSKRERVQVVASIEGQIPNSLFLRLQVDVTERVLFTEDWESGIIDSNKWISFGNPFPTLSSSNALGGFAMVSNGSSSWNSGVATKDSYALVPGLAAEVSLFMDSTPATLSLASLSIETNDASVFDDTYGDSGSSNRPIHILLIGNDSTVDPNSQMAMELGTWKIGNVTGFGMNWTRFGFEINADGSVSYFVNGNLTRRTEANVINFLTSPTGRIVLHGRLTGGSLTSHDNLILKLK
jgi:hypothetical protein